ncbi:Hypothetical predicted protein [Mytilus galloprovincialis]|uniref:Uncharacterized protein n=1 Tax=Mytilus galloprovincialis TaxID=29158 RepID=A0A8B6FPL8_MYTGA|nr:Hypothetical predicted protein [Mytilus galloprovincialis]
MGYTKTHHWRQATSSILRFYRGRTNIFIKVQNRAGLDQKIWFGPILADETPTVCQDIPKPVIDNGYVIAKWDKETFMTLNKQREIGSVMFRMGIGNTYITPFLEWNIKSHGGQCGLHHQCIKYPVKTLQLYDSVKSLDFHIQMHVYNYAGHYCSLNTPSFKLPNIVPPRHGIVLDVDPGTTRPYQDVDAIYDAKVYCFVMKGFTNEEIQFEVGVGNINKSDDAIAFRVFNPTDGERVCENIGKLKTEKQYYVIIRASYKSQEIYRVSSDGFIILNSTTVTTSMKIYHGNRCGKENELKSWNISSKKSVLTLFQSLQHGVTYSLLADSAAFVITNQNLLIKYHRQNSDQMIVTFMPIVSVSSVFIDVQSNHSNLSSYITLHLHQCDPDMGIQSSKSLLPMYWSINDKYEQYLSNYEIAICKMTNNTTCENKVLYESVGKNSFKYFLGNFKEGAYTVFVKACFGLKCLLPSTSNLIIVEQVKSMDMKVKASIQFAKNCTKTTFRWQKSHCTTDYIETFPLGYRWSVFKDEGNTRITDWKMVKVNEINETTQNFTVKLTFS